MPCLSFSLAGTDVAAEMSVLMDYLYSCRTCHKACTAAVEMLAVSYQLGGCCAITQANYCIIAVQVPTGSKTDRSTTF